MLVWRVRNLQSTNEHECIAIFNAVGNFGELVLDVVDVRFELSHFDGKEVMLILLGLLAGGVLGKEYLGYLLKLIERTR